MDECAGRDDDKLFTLAELSTNPTLRLRRGQKTLNHWVTQGINVTIDGKTKKMRLPASKIGRKYHACLADVRAFMQALCPSKPIGETA